jgi:hypothetical protein
VKRPLPRYRLAEALGAFVGQRQSPLAHVIDLTPDGPLLMQSLLRLYVDLGYVEAASVVDEFDKNQGRCTLLEMIQRLQGLPSAKFQLRGDAATGDFVEEWLGECTFLLDGALGYFTAVGQQESEAPLAQSQIASGQSMNQTFQRNVEVLLVETARPPNPNREMYPRAAAWLPV